MIKVPLPRSLYFVFTILLFWSMPFKFLQGHILSEKHHLLFCLFSQFFLNSICNKNIALKIILFALLG